MTPGMRIWQRSMLTIAVGWGLALPVLALVVPSYRGESVEMPGDSTTTTTSTTATLVQVDGWWALLTVSVPLVVAVLVTILLARRHPPAGPGAAVTVLVALLGAGTFLAMMSVGIFVLPVTGCLAVAWAIRLAGAVPAAGRAAPTPPAMR